MPSPKPGILEIAPYVGGRSAVSGRATAVKLSSNETPLGPSPKTREAFLSVADRMAHYPDGSCADLRAAIARRYGLAAERIVCGNGSDDLLALLGQAYVAPGDEVIYSQYGFVLYRQIILTQGARPVMAPERNFTTDVDAVLAAVTDKTRLVFLANPNNPTGTYLTSEEVFRLHAGLPEHVVLVLDAAYAEYVCRDDYDAGAELVDRASNVVMTRTFSKIYGLAALRLGWAYGSAEIVDVLNRIRGPFNVSMVAQAVGRAAVEDVAFTEKAVAHTQIWRDWLYRELTALGLEVTPGVANFLLIHFEGRGGKTAADADAYLQGRGLILRRLDAYGLPHCLRLSIGLEADNRAVVAALKDFLER